jgi:hypothetical protein
LKLSDLGFFNTPMGARPVLGMRNELGDPVYRDVGGNTFDVMPNPAPPGPGLIDTIMGVVSDPMPTLRALPRGLLDAAVSAGTAPARAARGEPVTYGDAFDTAGLAALGSVGGVAPAGALRSGLSRSQTAAQDVADMLRSGRAADVTDEMMAAVDPQEMWRLYEAGATGADMPMDFASRMARAQGMGFDTGTQLYHGTGADFPAFDRARFQQSDYGTGGAGVYSTSDTGLAGAYSDLVTRPSGDGANILPILARRVDAFDNGGYRNINSAEESRAYSRRMQDLGVDNVFYRDSVTGEIVENTTFDPRNIRSRFARFDPRLSHLSNLNAANASPLIGAGAMAGTDNLTQDEITALVQYLADQS